MKFGSRLVLATASLVLGLASVEAKPASAAIVDYAFTVNSPTKTGSGLFRFDDSTLLNGEAIVQSLSFQFAGESTIYTEQDDPDYPNFPIVFLNNFSTGQISFALDYQFDDQTNPGSFIRYEIAGEDFTIYSVNDPNFEVISGTVSYTQVPEPAMLGGLVLAGTVTFMKRKKLVVR
ncbi:PEP-CTERM sorting domain-containing protein [Nostoc parmelioides]|uniref:PEP-CTERM sorting domain-containing protein n=1 Tax=Nostoc parmelioides FACHB-3921 TaxID=2692909 RepID=A0ABR8BFK5_9NOSO|nr:PEP-CTERM sorting domain-containing protein [Nostoc parmelioides]MBD2252648.1 PEP-CTERM sorting domain-containing protein [Nostoc parmelioides FACHB-3921]